MSCAGTRFAQAPEGAEIVWSASNASIGPAETCHFAAERMEYRAVFPGALESKVTVPFTQEQMDDLWTLAMKHRFDSLRTETKPDAPPLKENLAIGLRKGASDEKGKWVMHNPANRIPEEDRGDFFALSDELRKVKNDILKAAGRELDLELNFSGFRAPVAEPLLRFTGQLAMLEGRTLQEFPATMRGKVFLPPGIHVVQLDLRSPAGNPTFARRVQVTPDMKAITFQITPDSLTSNAILP